MRIGARPSFLLVLLLSSVLLLQPLSAEAADCSHEKAAVDALEKDIAALKIDLKLQLDKLANPQRDMALDLRDMYNIQQSLVGEGERVQEELDNKGLTASLKTLGLQVFLSVLIGFAGPEGVAALAHEFALLAEAADRTYTAVELYHLYQEAGEAQSVMDALTSELGAESEVRAFADANNLTELKDMLDKEDHMAALQRNFDKAFAQWRGATYSVLHDQDLLDLDEELLKNANAVYAECLNQAGPVPSACEGQATNPNGAGVCR